MAFLGSHIRKNELKNIQGVYDVFNNINAYIEQMKTATLAGMIKAAALVRWETEHGPRRTPVDYGNLRSSWFVVSSKGSIVRGGGTSHTETGLAEKFTGPKGAEVAGSHAATLSEMKTKANILSKVNGGPFVIMGYSANYAFYVHEMLGTASGKTVNWSRKKSGPHWFIMALKKQRNNMLGVIAGTSSVSKYTKAKK
jgi:hypothetical protein